MSNKKQYITISFNEPERKNCYRVRSVPIRQFISLCGIEGFAVHRSYRHWDSEEPERGLWVVSHIETGMKAGVGETVAKAIEDAEEGIARSGGCDEVLNAIARSKKILKRLKLFE